MTTEPRELGAARRRLAQAERLYRTEEGLARLTEGLALLEDVIHASNRRAAEVARNLASSYAARIVERIEQSVAAGPDVPEPELEHFFRMLLAFDGVDARPPRAAETLKIEIVRRLVDRYYEGHAPEDKRAALARLEELASRR